MLWIKNNTLYSFKLAFMRERNDPSLVDLYCRPVVKGTERMWRYYFTEFRKEIQLLRTERMERALADLEDSSDWNISREEAIERRRHIYNNMRG